MSKPRVARAEICDDEGCAVTHLLVRGDQISFVSVEQVRRVGYHPLNERAMPSDITLPPSYVLVQDTEGFLLGRCEFFIVRWHGGAGREDTSNMRRNAIRSAQQYFGAGTDLRVGSVEIPDGPWKRKAMIRCIRYRRFGYDRGLEHEYKPPVWLSSATRPLAWKLSLPDACIVDTRGFVKP